MKITNKRELAIELSKRAVLISEVSKKLERIINLWVSRNEIKNINGKLILS